MSFKDCLLSFVLQLVSPPQGTILTNESHQNSLKTIMRIGLLWNWLGSERDEEGRRGGRKVETEGRRRGGKTDQREVGRWVMILYSTYFLLSCPK